MSKKAKILQNLYLRGKVTKKGLQQAVMDGVITEEEYIQIIGYNVI